MIRIIGRLRGNSLGLPKPDNFASFIAVGQRHRGYSALHGQLPPAPSTLQSYGVWGRPPAGGVNPRIGRRSIQIYNKLSPVQRRISLLPAPIKALTTIGVTAGLIFVLGPILLLVGPPLGLVGYLYFRRLRAKRSELFKQRWANMGSYHLAFDESSAIKPRDRIPRSVRTQVIEAINRNQDGLATAMGIDESFRTIASELRFTDVEGIEQEFKGSSAGFQEQMVISTFGVLDINTGQRLATIDLVTVKKNNDQKLRIEITTTSTSQRFVLGGGQENSDVLEVKGRRIS
jgi:hypothetical protein